jgi:transporter family protein
MRWLVYAIAGAAANATAGTLAKAGLEKVEPLLATAITTVVAAAATTAVCAVSGKLGAVREVEGKSWVYLVLAGIVTTASFLFYFRALGDGESSRVQPIDRLSLVFAVILATIFLHEKVNAKLVIGSVLMAAGAIVVATSATK